MVGIWGLSARVWVEVGGFELVVWWRFWRESSFDFHVSTRLVERVPLIKLLWLRGWNSYRAVMNPLVKNICVLLAICSKGEGVESVCKESRKFMSNKRTAGLWRKSPRMIENGRMFKCYLGKSSCCIQTIFRLSMCHHPIPIWGGHVRGSFDLLHNCLVVLGAQEFLSKM